MQNRISYHILSLLYLNGRVRIPGIGRIVHEYNEAAENTGESTITPPQTKGVFFEEPRGKNRLLERFIAYKTHISRTRARREIARFSNKVKSDIKSEGKADLKYLGTLFLQDDTLRFSPHEEILNPGYSALKKIQLPSRISIEEETESAPYATIDTTVPVMETVAEEIAPTPEEIVPIEHGQPAPMEFTVVSPEPEIVASTPVLTPEKTETIVIPVVASKSQAVTRQPSVIPIPAVKTKPQVAEKKDKRWSIALPVAAIILLGLLATAFLFYKSRISNKDSTTLIDTTSATNQIPPLVSSDEHEGAEEIVNTEAETKIALADTGIHEESEVNQVVEKQPAAVAENNIPVSATQESIFVATGECLIVLGAFSVADNRDRMVSRLQAMGYTTLTNPRGQLTQVGVPVDCKASNLQVVLEFLRKNVEQEAWVSRPK